VADVLNDLAVVDGSQGKHKEAAMYYRRALAIFEKKLGPDNPNTAILLQNLALAHLTAGKYSEAEQLLDLALLIREKNFAPNQLELAPTLSDLAVLQIGRPSCRE